MLAAPANAASDCVRTATIATRIQRRDPDEACVREEASHDDDVPIEGARGPGHERSLVARPRREILATRTSAEGYHRSTAGRLLLSEIAGCPLLGPAGDRVGQVADCVVRLAEAEVPPLTGLVLQSGGHDTFVPRDDLATLSSDGAHLAVDRVGARRFERRPGVIQAEVPALVRLAGGELGRS
jgi:hypothetical protein